MTAAQNTLTLVYNELLAVAAKYPGIGVSVTYYQRSGGVATLTTQNPHGFTVGDRLVVRGTGDSTFDGEPVITVVGSPTTFSYAAPGADVSTPVVCTAGASNRIGAGYRRFDEDENWEEKIEALTPETMGWFDLEIGRVTVSADDLDSYPARLKAALFVYVPKDVSTDLTTSWDLAISFFRALIASANFSGPWPNKLTFGLHDIETLESGGIACFDCGCFGEGGIELPNI